MTISPLQAVLPVSILPTAGANVGVSSGGGFFDGIKAAIANASGQASGASSTNATQAAPATGALGALGGSSKTADGSVSLMDGVLLKAGMGAAAGVGASFVIGPLGWMLGGAIGAIAGAGLGLFMNYRKIKTIQTTNVAQVGAMGVQPQNAEQQKALMTGEVAPLGISPEGSANQVLQTIQQQGGIPTSNGTVVGQNATQQAATNPTPTQGNGGAAQNATDQQMTNAFAPSITGSPVSVLGSAPTSSSGSALTNAAIQAADSDTPVLTPVDTLWNSSAASSLASGNPSGGGGPSAAAALPTGNDGASARARLDATHLQERRAAWKQSKAKVHAARQRLAAATTAAEKSKARADLSAARTEANATMHHLATRQVNETQNLAQFTTDGSDGSPTGATPRAQPALAPAVA